MKIITDIIQGTSEWYQARLGIPSSSCFDAIITTEGKPSKQAEKYMRQLAIERISGHPTESYQSFAMKAGQEKENKARLLYEMTYDCTVEQVGFCLHDSEKFGNSPDGLIDRQKGLEIKCPESHTFAEYKLNPEKAVITYKQQLQGSLLVTGYKSWDFCIYYPGIPLLMIEIKRDDSYCAILKVALEDFCTQLDALEKQLRNRK